MHRILFNLQMSYIHRFFFLIENICDFTDIVKEIFINMTELLIGLLLKIQYTVV